MIGGALRGALLVALLCGAPMAWGAGPHAGTARTSRWWNLECPAADRTRVAPPPACTLTVRLRGPIDASRLQLIRRAIARLEGAHRALRRDVVLQVDVDSPGGALFAALEIGRALREVQASVRVRDGASCVSACVLLLMGGVEREIGDAARVAIHRPSLAAPTPTPLGDARDEAIVAAMTESLVHYAGRMQLSRRIVDDMMSIPSEHLRVLKRSELVAYGIVAADPIRRVGAGTRRSVSPTTSSGAPASGWRSPASHAPN